MATFAQDTSSHTDAATQRLAASLAAPEPAYGLHCSQVPFGRGGDLQFYGPGTKEDTSATMQSASTGLQPRTPIQGGRGMMDSVKTPLDRCGGWGPVRRREWKRGTVLACSENEEPERLN